MFRVGKKQIAFMLSVCCLVTMVFGAGDGSVKAVSAQSSRTLSGSEAVAASTGSAVTSTTPAFEVSDAKYMGLSQLHSFSVPATQSALYYFNTTSQKAYYQVRAFVTSGTAFHIEIYDDSAETLLGSADLKNNAYTRFALSSSEKYILRITGENYISGQIMVSPVKDDFQDTRQTASAIAFNKQYAVNTDVENDVDYLRFTIGSQDATYIMMIEPTAGSSGSYELQDASGKTISAYSGTTNKSTVIRKKLTLTKQKTYYLKITSSEAYRQVVVYISMAINRYPIYYHLNGGSNTKSNPSVYVATNTIHLKNPKRVGYIFGGWYTSPKLTGRIATIRGTSKRTYHLYAKWNKVSVGKGAVTSFTSKKKGIAQVKFKKQAGVKGYQIRISTSSNFKKKTKTYTKKTTSVTFKKLTAGKRYYIAVRAFKTDSAGKRVYGAYSKTKSVKVFKEKPKKDDEKSTTKKNSDKKTTTKKSTTKKSSTKKTTTKKSTTKKSSTKKTTTKKTTTKKTTTKKTTTKKSTTKKKS